MTISLGQGMKSYEANEDKINKAISIAIQYGQIDGSHHKEWVIDQMVQILAGDEYNEIIKDCCNGEDGPATYTWSQGIAP